MTRLAPDCEEVLNPHLQCECPDDQHTELGIIAWSEVPEDMLVADTDSFRELTLRKLLLFEDLGQSQLDHVPRLLTAPYLARKPANSGRGGV